MTDIEDKMKQYSQKLDRIQKEQEEVGAAEQSMLERNYHKNVGETVEKLVDKIGAAGREVFQAPLLDKDFFAQVSLSNNGLLYEVDRIFIEKFQLEKYYPTSRILYPTIYCETLEEFVSTSLKNMNISDDYKKHLIELYSIEAENFAEKGGVFGVNLPGDACYINGWLFGRIHRLTPREALQDSHISRKIIETAVHEKLGHGFLQTYSELGKVLSQLNLYKMELAKTFGIQTSSNPIDKIRQQQYGILLSNSIFQQEGWSTWIESLLGGNGKHPAYRQEDLQKQIDAIPEKIKQQIWKKENLDVDNAFEVVLGDQCRDPDQILEAIKSMSRLEEILSPFLKFNQSLRYVLGEIICSRVELNQGYACVPYAALIAGNITLDPEKISLTDLALTMQNDPWFNPDARLVMLSKLKLNNPGDVSELAEKATNYLNMHVPVELRRK